MKILPRRALIPALAATVLVGGCAGMPTEREAAAEAQLERGRAAWRQGDYQAAVAPLKAAAAQGQVRALYALGYLHFYGRGVPQDRARGIEMIRRAAKAGDPLAIEALGQIADARGISRKPEEAGRTGDAGPDDAPSSAKAPAQTGDSVAAEEDGRVAETTGRGDGVRLPDTPPAGQAQVPAVGAAAPGETEGEDVASGTTVDAGWLKQRDPGHFTIELLAVRDQETVRRYRERYLTRSPPPEPVQVVEVVRRGRRWLLLVMGDYADRDRARQVIDGLPPLLKAGKPEPLQFRSLTASGPEAALGGN